MIVRSLALILVALALLAYGLVDDASSMLAASIAVSLLAALTLILGNRRAALGRERRVEQPSPDDRLVQADATGQGFDGSPVRESAYHRYGERQVVSRWTDHSAEKREHRPGMVARTDDNERAPGLRPWAPLSSEPSSLDWPPSVPMRSSSHTWRDSHEPPEDRRSSEHDDRDRAALGGARPYGDLGRRRDEWDDDSPRRDPFVDGEPEWDQRPAAEPVSANDLAFLARLDDEVIVVDGRPHYHLPKCAEVADDDGEDLAVNEAIELGFLPCGKCRPGRALRAGRGG